MENLEAYSRGHAQGVDFDARVIRGAVVAEAGVFATRDRGQFDEQSLLAIVQLMRANPAGVPAYYTHGRDSGEKLGSFLGRFRNARLDGRRVRADLFLDDSAFHTPSGDLGGYLMRLADSDPQAVALSMTLHADKLPVRGGSPVWRPIEIQSVDVVAFGEATPSGLLPMSAAHRSEDSLAEALAVLPSPIWAYVTRS